MVCKCTFIYEVILKTGLIINVMGIYNASQDFTMIPFCKRLATHKFHYPGIILFSQLSSIHFEFGNYFFKLRFLIAMNQATTCL